MILLNNVWTNSNLTLCYFDLHCMRFFLWIKWIMLCNVQTDLNLTNVNSLVNLLYWLAILVTKFVFTILGNCSPLLNISVTVKQWSSMDTATRGHSVIRGHFRRTVSYLGDMFPYIYLYETVIKCYYLKTLICLHLV